MSHLRIFDNPKGPWMRAGLAPLTLTGVLDRYFVGEAYESRLQIGNAMGDCSVVLTSGSLPNGATVTVDQDTDEVVIAWPAYAVISSAVDSLINADFEDGDTGDWILGASMAIGTWNWEYDGPDNDLQAYDGVNSVEYHAEARGNSQVVSAHPWPCAAGTSVTGSCQVQQGPSEANHTGGWVFLEFLDASGAVLSHTEGNHVDSGSDAEWHLSTVTATAPVGTASARLGAEMYRKKESKPMWVDTFSWNLAPSPGEFVGTNSVTTYSICVRVTDSAGRTATWCGSISTLGPLVLLYGTREYRGSESALTLSTDNYAPTVDNSGDWKPSANEDGSVIAGFLIGGYPLAIARWSGASGYVGCPITGYIQGSVWHQCISRDGNWVLSTSFGDNGFYVYQYDGAGSYAHLSFTNFGDHAKGICFSPDETQVVVSGFNSKCIRYDFDSTTGALSNPLAMTAGGGLGWSFVDWVGNYILLSDGESLRIVNATTMVTITDIAPLGSFGSRAYFSADAAYVYYFHRSYSFNGTALTLLHTYTSAGSGLEMSFMNARRTHFYFLNSATASDLYTVAGGVMTALTPPGTSGGFNAGIWTNR